MSQYVRHIVKFPKMSNPVKNALTNIGFDCEGWSKSRPFIIVDTQNKTVTQLDATQYEEFNTYEGPVYLEKHELLEHLRVSLDIVQLQDGVYFVNDDQSKIIKVWLDDSSVQIVEEIKFEHRIEPYTVLTVLNGELKLTEYKVATLGQKHFLVVHSTKGDKEFIHQITPLPKMFKIIQESAVKA